VFLGGAAVGAFHGNDAAGDFDPARKMGKGASVLIDRGEIDIQPGDVLDVAVVEFLNRVKEDGKHVLDAVASGAGELYPFWQGFGLLFCGRAGPAARHLFLIQFLPLAVQ
jgi:hypothetical protein